MGCCVHACVYLCIASVSPVCWCLCAHCFCPFSYFCLSLCPLCASVWVCICAWYYDVDYFGSVTVGSFTLLLYACMDLFLCVCVRGRASVRVCVCVCRSVARGQMTDWVPRTGRPWGPWAFCVCVSLCVFLSACVSDSVWQWMAGSIRFPASREEFHREQSNKHTNTHLLKHWQHTQWGTDTQTNALKGHKCTKNKHTHTHTG